MGKVRPLDKGKYDISKHKFWQMYHFCLQYNEWVDELRYKTDTVQSIEVTDMPAAHGGGNATEQLAMRREELSRKCRLVEQTALEADPELYQYIMKAVTNESITYNYLKMIMDIPCSKNTWYTRRKKFYWLLSQKI